MRLSSCLFGATGVKQEKAITKCNFIPCKTRTKTLETCGKVSENCLTKVGLCCGGGGAQYRLVQRVGNRGSAMVLVPLPGKTRISSQNFFWDFHSYLVVLRSQNHIRKLIFLWPKLITVGKKMMFDRWKCWGVFVMPLHPWPLPSSRAAPALLAAAVSSWCTTLVLRCSCCSSHQPRVTTGRSYIYTSTALRHQYIAAILSERCFFFI